MVNKLLKIGGICLMASLAGCVPDEDTSPSAALFPTTYYGEVRPDFSSQLASKSPRQDVELHALFGVCYSDQDKTALKLVQDALDQGYYGNSSNGKRIYRVQTIDQTQQLLQAIWAEEKWTPDSELAQKFRATPNASVAIISQKDQRILFFNQANQLTDVYPKAG